MFSKVLIANRGAIACRIIRTLDRMGVGSVAVYSEADRHSLHVAQAGEAVLLGPGPAAQSYLAAEKIIAACKATGAEAVHPGYGFLSENPDFAEALEREGIRFIGPRPDQMRAFGLKHTARELAEKAGVPLAPGSGLMSGVEQARAEAARIGYPVMIKSTAGGGGIGLQLCRSEAELPGLFERVERLAKNNFKDSGIYIEKYVERGRHIEVQIFGDGRGRVVALGERDCSAQRRNQKVVEETPAPGLTDSQRKGLWATAASLGKLVNYESAGTVEFILDADSGQFYFLEVNTRLQVEHGVTEQVTGLDLVEWMVRQAAGESLPLDQPHPSRGHSIQVRLYAEDPARNFRPSAGRLTQAVFPADARIESWVEAGTEVPPFYDPMLAKLIVTGAGRPDAVAKLQAALAATSLAGIETNLAYLRQLAASPELTEGRITTRSLDSFAFRPDSIEVITSGVMTSVQDYPGRVGYWDVGVPPSGPMDPLSFRLANRAVGNPEGAAALEITVNGPTLHFATDALVCLAGATTAAKLDEAPVPFWEPVAVKAGQTLAVGAVTGAGARAYLAVAGGFDVPDYLGSKATFTLGNFGGHGGRALLAGDVLHIKAGATSGQAIPETVRPALTHNWDIAVLYGPHGAPDFFTDDDIATFFATQWEVHYNSSRTGVRLIGPKPKWARTDGGEAGLHPSNIHDNAYAIGAIDFTGDMPVILGPDGPSLGGFVCPACLAEADLWKMGQLRPGDRIRFRPIGLDEAVAREAAMDRQVATLLPAALPAFAAVMEPAIRATLPASGDRPSVVYRRASDKYLLVEYGPPVLDLELRLRAHALMEWVKVQAIPGILELTPGIRSLQLHYDSRVLSEPTLLDLLRAGEAQLPANDDLEIPSRVVWLPLSWDDEATQFAIRKYEQSVRADAPWCPSNIEFIRRINGLDGIADVKRIVFDASYLVLGLGDVYLGAPVATPIDPRHRLVTTKYNPARTWTPENAVGIGGAYLCVYGMEGPGGYQFVGRTCQMWNSFHATSEFEPGKPWLLRFFDQLRFYEVSGPELLRFRDDFPHGKVGLKITQETLKLADYRRFLADNADSIGTFKSHQQASFEAERARWEASGQIGYAAELPDLVEADDDALPEGAEAVTSPVPGSVWKISVTPGQEVAAGETLLVIESMKMEIPLVAPRAGRVVELRCAEGKAVGLGQVLVVLD